ncbi:MAG: SMC-Scp complex subunit ScpB [Candidatus Komeilibacteria bacterium]
MNKSSLASSIESLLLVSAKPLSFRELAQLTQSGTDEVAAAVTQLQSKFNDAVGGIRLLVNDKRAQLATDAGQTKLIKAYLQSEITGELTRPSLETLTIVAYRQPVTKEELEQIRGVNCSLILRNLMIRGLVEPREAKGGLTTDYSVTMDFLRFLGITKVEELPDYERLHSHENIQAVLDQKQAEESEVSHDTVS